MTARQARRAKRRKASIQESRGLLMVGNRTPGKSERARRYTREWQRTNPGGIVMVYQGDRETRALAIMHMHARVLPQVLCPTGGRFLSVEGA